MASNGDFFVTSTSLGVQNVHMIDGQDIIGNVTDFGAALKIVKPVFPNVNFDQNTGRMGVGLLPLRPYLNQKSEEITVSKTHVIYNVPVGEQMEKLYQQFTSSIVVADVSALRDLQ